MAQSDGVTAVADARPLTRSEAPPRRGSRWRAIASAVLGFIFVVPLAVTVLGSLRPPGMPPGRNPGVSTGMSVQSYRDAFDLVDLATQLRNSLLVVVVATPVAVLSASLAGFVIARSGRRVRVTLLGLAVVAIVVPPTALVLGRFVLYRQLGVLDTNVPLIAPALYGVNAMGVLLYAWSFGRIPVGLFETAVVEGVSPLAIWWRIGMPLVRPMTVAVGTLAFVATWNDFLSPLFFVSSPERFTVPLGLRSLQLIGQQDLPVLLAACVVATVPVVLAFAVAQRRLFESVGSS